MTRGIIEKELTAPGVAVVVMSGEHDVATAPSLREQLDAELDAGRGVVVELGVTAFLDSMVLGVLVGVRRRALEQALGFALVVTDDSPVRRTLEVAGFLTLFPVYASREDAVAAARPVLSG